MQILWGAVRAASVETFGVLVVLWMLQGASGVALNFPWQGNPSTADASETRDHGLTLVGRGASKVRNWRDHVTSAPAEQLAAVAQPVAASSVTRNIDDASRAEYARERLDHFSQLYGIATRN